MTTQSAPTSYPQFDLMTPIQRRLHNAAIVLGCEGDEHGFAGLLREAVAALHPAQQAHAVPAAGGQNLPGDWLVDAFTGKGMTREADALRFMLSLMRGSNEDANWQGQRRQEVQAENEQLRAQLAAVKESLTSSQRDQELALRTIKEARKDREHAEAYYRQAEALLTGNEANYLTEINRLRNVIQAACSGGLGHMIERWKVLFPDAPVPTVRQQPAAAVPAEQFRVPDNAAIDTVLAEYNYPANPKNAARAGWTACYRAVLAACQSAQETTKEQQQ